MGCVTALCSLKMTAADLEKVIRPLCALCFEEKTQALTVIQQNPKSFEQILLEQIGRYSEDGSYIEMVDKNGTAFRWVFANGGAQKVKPVLLWPKPAAQ